MSGLPPPPTTKGQDPFKDTSLTLPSLSHIVSELPEKFLWIAHHEEGLRFDMVLFASSHGCLSDELTEILLF